MLNGIGSGSINSSYYSNGITKVKIPTAPNMRTKGQCKLNEKELVEKIKELARRDAASGKNSQYAETFHGVRQGSAEWRKLKDDFVSSASPNRREIIQNTLSNLAGKVNSIQLKGDGRFDLFKILFNNCKKFGADVNVNFVSFRDEQGNEIAYYSEANGWQLLPAPAESVRNNAFNALWKQALLTHRQNWSNQQMEKLLYSF